MSRKKRLQGQPVKLHCSGLGSHSQTMEEPDLRTPRFPIFVWDNPTLLKSEESIQPNSVVKKILQLSVSYAKCHERVIVQYESAFVKPASKKPGNGMSLETLPSFWMTLKGRTGSCR